ncbi:Ldh family oxidoreductase [Actinomadura sp. KC216]|uniref:Ldh family oxidoreductase n=1 Tax=Actinomadura sp. KC216 TaxID=2530370 RepID=UPI00104523CB|nr:Ldh family oxidoreductase [Actinomadura sp. KC216]TDB87922.1 Ldh family oxidoreductase [Actinomadura sp. KC216]
MTGRASGRSRAGDADGTGDAGGTGERVSAERLRRLATAVLGGHGVPGDDAALVADVLVEANLRGHDSHGVARLPRICEGLGLGAIRPVACVETVRDGGAAVLLDGRRSLGPVAGVVAADRAVRRAAEHGLGVVGMRGASHLGMIGYYAERIAVAGMIGLVLTNSEPAMAPYGGAERKLGTNALALGFPTGAEPILVDMSTSVAARGKIMVAQRRGESIPPGWAVDADGADTTDPAAALDGALQAMAGAKGYCLAVAVDLLTGALTGGGVGSEVSGTFDMRRPSNKGDLLVAARPEALAGDGVFLDGAGRLMEDLRSARTRPGVAEILLPGEVERRTRTARLVSGVEVDPRLLDELRELAEPTRRRHGRP